MSLDLVKTIAAVAALLFTGVAGIISVKTDIATISTTVELQTSEINRDIADIRATQLESSGRIEKLYDAFIASKLAFADER